ncbi:MAG TPA: vWA domain-containing protein [Thermoanaerobaculia bacterium]|nr:vWA domain-containing protein [Thermoanaerobaculia bacterium]
MRRLPLVVVVLFLTGALHAQTLGPVDWIFLVDTSKSMRGIGGTKDIWTDVKVSLDAFVKEAGEQDTLTLYAFDRDVREINAASRSDLYRAILTLDAEGTRTHLGAAIAKGLDHAESLRLARADSTRRQVVVLFTDGKQDVRGIENPVSIDSSVDRVGESFVYFVSMGDHELQLDEFAAHAERAEVMRAPTPEAIRNIAREIRAKIPPPKKPEPTRAPPPSQRPPSPPPAPKPSRLATLLKVAIPLALLALIAYVVLQQHRRKNRLEGELEILRPRAAPDAAFVGLPKLQVSEIALSAILPIEALAGSDARLFVRRNGDRKKVWIAAQSGSLRINEVETPLSELYDADTIEIGDAKVRFNRVGDDRPLESNQESEL